MKYVSIFILGAFLGAFIVYVSQGNEQHYKEDNTAFFEAKFDSTMSLLAQEREISSALELSDSIKSQKISLLERRDKQITNKYEKERNRISDFTTNEHIQFFSGYTNDSSQLRHLVDSASLSH